MGCCYGCRRPGWNDFDDLTCGDQWCSCHDYCATGGRPLDLDEYPIGPAA